MSTGHTMPGATYREQSAGKPPSPETVCGGKYRGTALVIVDDEAVARATAMLLREFGYEVLAARDSEQAIERLRELALTPDVLICDDYLASGETGIEAILAIRGAVRRTVPAVFALWESAGPLEAAASQVAECRMLHKPIAAPALLHLVADAWRNPGRMQSSERRAAGPLLREPSPSSRDARDARDAWDAPDAREAREAREPAAMEEAVAILAHELRSPLAAIGSALDVWRVEAGRDTERRARERAERQLRKAASLIGQLLDFSSSGHGHAIRDVAEVDLAKVVTNSIDEVSHALVAHHHVLSLDVPAHRVLVRGDGLRLEQVVVNLVGNSAKFTPDGGRIDVKLACEGGEAVLVVRDNGIGIDPQMLPAVFEPFIQLSHRPDSTGSSLGIGLTVTRRIVELHGGTIEGRSAGQDQGSEFIVRLPMSPRPACGH